MEAIKFNDPAADYLELKDEIDAALSDVLSRGDYIQGRAVDLFEKSFAEYLGVSRAVGVASGTDAIHLALRAAGVGEGDLVVTAANTFTATAMAIIHAGATPLFIDVNPMDLNLDPDLLPDDGECGVKAVVPVHLYGQPADMDPILSWAEGRGAAVIEDACQAHGATYKGKRAGTMGAASAFSFYPTKNLGGVGDAGMVATSSPEIDEKVRLLANYGSVIKNRHDCLGFNSRLDSLQAAVLMAKLKKLDEWNGKRRSNASYYGARFEEEEFVNAPVTSEGRIHVFHQYVIRVPSSERDELRERLKARGVPTLIHYPTPVHLQPAFAFLGMGPGDCPEAEAAAGEIVSLPVHQHLSPSQLEAAADAVLEEIRALTREGSS